MTKLRTEADDDPELKASFISSLKSVTDSRFKNILLKEIWTICSKACNDNEIDVFFFGWSKPMKILKWARWQQPIFQNWMRTRDSSLSTAYQHFKRFKSAYVAKTRAYTVQRIQFVFHWSCTRTWNSYQHQFLIQVRNIIGNLIRFMDPSQQKNIDQAWNFHLIWLKKLHKDVLVA